MTHGAIEKCGLGLAGVLDQDTEVSVFLGISTQDAVAGDRGGVHGGRVPCEQYSGLCGFDPQVSRRITVIRVLRASGVREYQQDEE